MFMRYLETYSPRRALATLALFGIRRSSWRSLSSSVRGDPAHSLRSRYTHALATLVVFHGDSRRALALAILRRSSHSMAITLAVVVAHVLAAS